MSKDLYAATGARGAQGPRQLRRRHRWQSFSRFRFARHAPACLEPRDAATET